MYNIIKREGHYEEKTHFNRINHLHTYHLYCDCGFIIKNRNRSTSNTMYTYSNVNPDYNYSEDNVLYLDDSGILHLIDTASGKDIVYCDKPNCTHEGYSRTNQNPSCPAAFYGLSKAGAVIYNDHLYFIGNMSDEDMTIQYLYVMDSNGENRKNS